MKKLILLIILCITLGSTWWTFSAFQEVEKIEQKPTKEDLIAAAVQERIDIFTKTRKKACLDDRLADAVLRVDSILIARAKSQRDTFNKPAKPFKPEKPEILILEDTTPIAPLIVEKDSLE